MQFYTGWLDHWGEPHQHVDSDFYGKALDKVLALGANINMYMAIGGTSFGFEAGANDPPFRPSPTSYDYDAPISEAGDLREKYFAIRDVIKKYLPIPDIPVNASDAKGHYGPVTLEPVTSLIHEPHLFTEFRATNLYPMTFEAMGQAHGFVLYETMIEETFSDPTKLEIPGIHDRGYVFVDGEPQVPFLPFRFWVLRHSAE
jgi:beta-galactosidase